MSRTERMPRYHPTQTHVGCHQHGDPICLCDVIITQPCPVNNRYGVMFGTLALKELGATTVSERNIVPFFQIVIGCHNRFVKMRPVLNPLMLGFDEEPINDGGIILMDTERAARNNRRAERRAKRDAQQAERRQAWEAKGGAPAVRPRSDNAWGRLPDDVRKLLVAGYRMRLPWSEAKSAIEHLQLSGEDVQYIAKRYRIAAANKDIQRQVSNRKQTKAEGATVETTVQRMRHDPRGVSVDGESAIR